MPGRVVFCLLPLLANLIFQAGSTRYTSLNEKNPSARGRTKIKGIFVLQLCPYVDGLPNIFNISVDAQRNLFRWGC